MPYFKNRFDSKLKFIFDAIKNSIVVSGTVRHEAVSANNADSTLWIVKEQPIDREIPINNKEASCEATLVLSDEVSKLFGGGWRDRTDDPLLAKQVLSQLS
jgi:hypothetical protein